MKPLKTVWITHSDPYKDFSDASKFGEVYPIVQHLPRSYDTTDMVVALRRALREYEPDDYFSPIGDPTLSGICMSIILEMYGTINVLKWDKRTSAYILQVWTLEQSFTTADD